jgi:NAD(P)-dependent dehydrogenase (short-subunit alcohol dehydrogenase family)
MAPRSFLVTGASSGIGRATALRLDRAHHRVFAGVRRDSDADTLRAEASERLTPVLLDVTDAASLDAAVKTVEGVVGDAGLDGTVNNAGIAIGAIQEFLDLDELRQQLEVNVVGVAAVTRAFLPLIRKAKGRIVNVGSLSGYVSAPFTGPYNASKHALEGLTDSLRRELRLWDLSVSLIEPGTIKTPIWDKAQSQTGELRAKLSEEQRALYGPVLDVMDRFVARSSAGNVPPDAVARAIEHALTARRPRTRYRVGLDARAAWWTLRLLPDRWVDAFLARFAGLPRRL